LHKLRGPILAGMALLVPLVMLTWFAPLLIVFRKLTLLPALKASLAACIRNLGAFLLYGVLVFILWLFATLPMAGGARSPLIDVLTIIALAVVLSVIFGSIYASYMDIFERPADGEAPAPSGNPSE
jgi:hypothetical protein